MNVDIKPWIIKAEEDYLVATKLSKSAVPFYNSVCFHCQQCIEKYMKAIMAKENIDIIKSHDLKLLLGLIESRVPALKLIKKELTNITDWAVNARYPGAVSDKNDAKLGVDTMKLVRKIIRGYLGLKNKK
jgi:HEPN domain-containing protein